MVVKDFIIKQKTSSGYDVLHPETRAEQVIINQTTGATLDTHLDDDAAHGIGNKATLLTTNKASIVGALNELFTNANSLKSDWAGVVGSPLIPSDTSAQLKSKTQTIKNTLATNLNAKGQPSTGSESLTSLINKVPNINTGLRRVTGTITATTGQRAISISNIPFVPGYLTLYLAEGATSPIYGSYVSNAVKRETFRRAGAAGNHHKYYEGYNSGGGTFKFDAPTSNYQPTFGENSVGVSIITELTQTGSATLSYIIFEDGGV